MFSTFIIPQHLHFGKYFPKKVGLPLDLKSPQTLINTAFFHLELFVSEVDRLFPTFRPFFSRFCPIFLLQKARKRPIYAVCEVDRLLQNLRHIKPVNRLSDKFFFHAYAAHDGRTNTISEGIPHRNYFFRSDFILFEYIDISFPRFALSRKNAFLSSEYFASFFKLQ